MKLLKGVVKDHRLPMDYKMSLTQPTSSAGFMMQFKKSFMKRMITKQYAQLPLFCFFGIVVPYFLLQSYVRYKQTGSLP